MAVNFSNPFRDAQAMQSQMSMQNFQPVRQANIQPENSSSAVSSSGSNFSPRAAVAFGRNIQQPQAFDRSFLAQAKENHNIGLSPMQVGMPLGDQAINGVAGRELNLMG